MMDLVSEKNMFGILERQWRIDLSSKKYTFEIKRKEIEHGYKR